MFNTPASSNEPQGSQPRSLLNSTTITIAVIVVAIAVIFLLYLSLSGRVPMLSFTARHFLIALGLLSVLTAVVASVIYRQCIDPSNAEGVISATVLMNIVIFISLGLVTVSVSTATGASSWAASIIWSLAMMVSGGAVGFLFGIPRNRTGKSGVPPAPMRAADPSTTKKPATPTPTPDPAAAGQGAPNPNPDSNAAGQPALAPNAAAQDAANPPGAVNAPDQPPAAPPTPPTDGQPLSGDGDDTPPPIAAPIGSETAIEQISDWLTKIIVGVGLTNLKEMPGQLNRLALYVGNSIDQTHPNQYLALGIVIYFSVVGVITGYLVTQLFLHKLVNQP